MLLWIIMKLAASSTVPFFPALDTPDPQNLSDKGLFTLAGLALFAGGTAKSVQMSTKRFEEEDLSL